MSTNPRVTGRVAVLGAALAVAAAARDAAGRRRHLPPLQGTVVIT